MLAQSDPIYFLHAYVRMHIFRRLLVGGSRRNDASFAHACCNLFERVFFAPGIIIKVAAAILRLVLFFPRCF